MSERGNAGDAHTATCASRAPDLSRAGAGLAGGTAWQQFVLIAAAYFVTALAARLLALPPGHAAPLWPAAGVALAALLLCGIRRWPGVWLGAFLADVWLETSLAGAAIAALDATGATLQAMLGAWITRRLFDAPIPLVRSEDLWRFLLRAGPLASLVSATIGVATLHAFGRIETSEIVGQWLLWWVGCTLGVLLFAPLALRLALPRLRRLWAHDGTRVTMPLMITAALLATGNLGMDRLEQSRAQRATERLMEQVHDHAFLTLPTAINSLRGFGSFFAASDEVTRQEFTIYASHVLDQSGLIAVEWAPRVAQAQRQAFEATASRELGRAYHVFERDSAGDALAPAERAEYFPLLYLEPWDLNADVLGLDSGATARQQAAMTQARDSGRSIAAEVVPLMRTGRPGVVVLVPVYQPRFDPRSATVEARRGALQGYVRGVFDLDALFFSLARETERKGLGFRVSDITAGDAARILESTLPADTAADWTKDLDFAGRLWRLELQSVRPPWQPGASVDARLYLMFSVAAALLVVFATLGSASRRAASEALVAERTTALERELRARHEAEATLRASEEDLDTTLRSIGDAVMATDVSGRITRLNAVAERLTGWTLAEAFGRPVEEIFTIINEESRRPAVIPVENVLRTGEIHGLANHTILIGRDGTEYAIADSAAPIIDASGALRGVVLVFRDVSDERAAALALQASEARYRRFIDESPYGVFVQCDGCFVFLNPKASALLGAASATELVGRPVLDFLHPDSREAVRARIRRLHADRTAVPALEEKWLRLDGSVFHGEATAVPYEHQGRSAALVLLQDITARKDAEAQRDRFFELSLDPFCIANTDGRLLRVNPAFSETLGWSEEELLAISFLDLVHPDDLAATRAEIETLRAGVPTLRFENRFRCKDGSWRWLAWNSKPEPGGLIFATAHDTTGEHEAQQRLRELNTDLQRRVQEREAALDGLNAKEEEIRAVVDNLADCVVTIDAHGIVRSANPAVGYVLGYTAEELIGRNVSMLMPEPHASLHDEYLARYRDGGEARIIGVGREVEGRHKDGRLIPLELTVNEYSVRDERLFIGTLRDVRERKALISQLTRARVDAEEASRAKSAFLATMSHEIRTPMNGVIGMVDVLVNSRLSEHQADLVGTIKQSAGALLAIIDDILDFSKIEAGRLDIECAPVSVADLVEGLCNSLIPVATRRGVDLTLFVSPEVPERVLSDDVRLRQVLYNLVGNAIKFSAGRPEEPGRVSVRVEVVERTPLRLTFRIADNGIGIAPEALELLFTPFSQAEVSTTRRFGGTGLGLAICKRLVDLMQGQMTVESVPDAGSIFTVTLPFVRAGEQPARALPDLVGIDCILVASQELEAEDLRIYLEHAGAHVMSADDEGAAMAVAATRPGPVVLIQAGGQAQQCAPLARSDTTHVHRLLITRGRRRRARVADRDTIVIDGDAMRRPALLRAVAMAAGRASPEAFEVFDPCDGARLTTDETPPPSVGEARAVGRLILVAEDDEINQKVILQQLALLGHAAEIAGNGAEALRLWHNERYALLLTDLHMPEMDGYTLATAIRRAEVTGRARTPILALTANALRGEANRAHAAGIDEYLTKPVQLQVLRAALDKWMPVNGPTPPAPTPDHGCDGQGLSAPVDVAVLKALVGDDAETVQEFLADYLGVTTRLAPQLRSAAAQCDAQMVAAIAHKLKSSSRAVGALALGNLCAELEHAASANNGRLIGHTVTAFDPALAEVEASIRALLAGNA